MKRPAVLFLALIVAGIAFVGSLDAGPVEACGAAIITLLIALILGGLLTRKHD